MEIQTSVKEGVRTIRFANERKKNAISSDGYKQVTDILRSDANNDDVVITIITGTGEYFTSGNDLSKPLSLMGEMQLDEIMEIGFNCFKNMVQAFLDYPKLIIAVVNGPAIGVGVTICGLCDVTYASDTATFYTPFVKLALCIEGCGSYLLPRIMGRSKASEMLLLGKKIIAAEALQFNLVSEVIPKHEIDAFIESLHKHGKIPVKQLINNKWLMKENLRKQLCECLERECKELKKAQASEEFSNTILEFISRKKSKL